MLKISGLINDSAIISDYCAKKGYQAKLMDSSQIGKEYDNPESEADFFDRILTNHINTIVNDCRQEKAIKELKFEKVNL
jgi:hypothetical protein